MLTKTPRKDTKRTIRSKFSLAQAMTPSISLSSYYIFYDTIITHFANIHIFHETQTSITPFLHRIDKVTRNENNLSLTKGRYKYV